MNISGTVTNMAIALSLTGASVMLWYFAFRKRDDDEVDLNRRSNQKTIESDPISLEIPIPGESVGIVIGRQGVNIKCIQEKSKTKINFKDEVSADTSRTCVITGGKESVAFAQSLIQDLIRNQPLITTSEMLVPVKAIGRIIGRCGENIHSIVVASGAKVNVENVAPKDNYAPRRVLLKGTIEQINVAKTLIEAKVVEDRELRSRYESGAATRSPRSNKSPQYLMAGDRVEPEDEAPLAERLSPMKSDKSMEVYMSAVESPSTFWVQIISPSATELDQLVEKMTNYYSKQENQELHMIHEVITVGQLVAAPFRQDKKWYRAQVIGVSVNDYDVGESELELYYVDYGDCYDVKQKEVMEVSTDFLMLPRQAIECSLAKVKPIGDTWSDEATDLFDELTENAQWKVILCKIDHYDPTIQRRQDRGRREGSPVPVVELFNIQGSKDINVGEELVKNRLAVYKNPSQAAAKPAVREARAQSKTKGDGSKPFDEASSSTSRTEVGAKPDPMAAHTSKVTRTYTGSTEAADKCADKSSLGTSTSGAAVRSEPEHQMAADTSKAVSDHAKNSPEMSKSPGSGQPKASTKMAADALKVIAAHNRSLEMDKSRNLSPPNASSKMAADATKEIASHNNSPVMDKSTSSSTPKISSKMAADAMKVIAAHNSAERGKSPASSQSKTSAKMTVNDSPTVNSAGGLDRGSGDGTRFSSNGHSK